MSAAIQQRCWTHEGREAVCRCPQCGRSYCRECVTEHEGRLLCAACLVALARAERRPGRRVGASVALVVVGVLLAWLVFYGAGEAMILITGRMEQSWQQR